MKPGNLEMIPELLSGSNCPLPIGQLSTSQIICSTVSGLLLWTNVSRGCAGSKENETGPWVEDRGSLKKREKETKLDISLSCASQPGVP